ncbi:MAG: hypothetical protein ACAH59_03525 [Pseudobdellovibrionaceae bacterium]
MSKILFAFMTTLIISQFLWAQNYQIRQMEACQARNHYWISDTESCEPCPAGQKQNPETGQCYYLGSKNSTSNSNSSSSSRPSQASAAVSCEAATQKAIENCDPERNSDVQTAKSVADGIVRQLRMGAQASPAALCGQMGSFAQTLDMASGSYNGYCSKGYLDCENACEIELTQIKASVAQGAATAEEQAAVEKNLRTCKKLSQNVRGIAENIQGYAQIEQMKSQYCIGKTDPLAEYCKMNPSASMCKNGASTNCSDPTMAATNTTCICFLKPNSPACPNANVNEFGSNMAGKISGGGPGEGTDGMPSLGDIGTAGSFPSGIGMEGPPFKPGSDDGMGGQKPRGAGGRANLDMNGNGQNAKGGGKGGAPGGSGYNTKTIGGYGYGGAGGGSYGSGSAASPSAPYGSRGGMGGPGGKNVDLRQFMPGGKMDPSRGLAGISGPDGITGPHSNIWQKINARYFSVKHSLLP